MSVSKRLFARIQPTFQAVQRASGLGARALLGKVDWQAPPWAKWTAARIRQGAQATVAHAGAGCYSHLAKGQFWAPFTPAVNFSIKASVLK